MITRLPQFLFGGDYNPEQWDEAVWDDDVRLMRDAGINAMTIGVFSWACLEPADGAYDFGWMDRIVDKLTRADIHIVLATPTAATPPWMSMRYPETLRVRHDGLRHPHRVRVNYCPSSGVYRDKSRAIAGKLAERYGKHESLLLWHINNEYHGDCHCDLCQAGFRKWLERRHGDLDALNRHWWTAFWSHRYGSWDEVHSPGPWPHGEWSQQALWLDWNRFTGELCREMYRNEAEAIRPHSPGVPLTHNLHGILSESFSSHWRVLADDLDVMSWDNYPGYQDDGRDVDRAVLAGFQHDLVRSMKPGRPYLMMESNPGAGPGTPQQRPGALRRTALQAIGHGAESVQYFQWRNGRGQIEKFHGACVEHAGHADTRMFREVASLGRELPALAPLLGSTRRAEVAVVFDRENHWALELGTNARWDDRDYVDTCLRHYRPFWRRGVNVDVIHQYADLDPYRLVVAPLAYMLLPGFAERITAFVEGGGCLVTGYWSGYVDEHDRCFRGGFPGPLRELCGLWVEELDGLTEGRQNRVRVTGDLGFLRDAYTATRFCDVIRVEDAEVLATFEDDYYAGMPALCRRTHGEGECIYVGFSDDGALQNDLSAGLIERRALSCPLPHAPPEGVHASSRRDDEREYLILSNFAPAAKHVTIGAGWRRLADGATVTEVLELPERGAEVLTRARANPRSGG